ncbi:hypothetical protein PVAND_002173 [Polypedilum vanderplanki]|uniref:Uncharacterized protein n=1 Tax=Polypedilum vanderplanki TaxID=319348 RepID=A0A9J6BQI9_POLVA|nr:hypothetical protein PVAND_002173 [Polypedilum vanderplanki]
MNSILRNSVKLGQLSNNFRILYNSHKFISTTQIVRKDASESKPNLDEPIKFIGSPAQTFKAKTSRVGTIDPDEIPWFQPFAVVGSVAIFLIYFCVLREENDLDHHLGKSIFEQVPSLEAPTLISLYKYNIENNIDNTEVIKRMLDLGIDPMKIQ